MNHGMGNSVHIFCVCRVTLVVKFLSWDDYHFGHSRVRLFLLGREELGRICWVEVEGSGTSKINENQPWHASTRITLYSTCLHWRGRRRPVPQPPGRAPSPSSPSACASSSSLPCSRSSTAGSYLNHFEFQAHCQ